MYVQLPGIIWASGVAQMLEERDSELDEREALIERRLDART